MRGVNTQEGAPGFIREVPAGLRTEGEQGSGRAGVAVRAGSQRMGGPAAAAARSTRGHGARLPETLCFYPAVWKPAPCRPRPWEGALGPGGTLTASLGGLAGARGLQGEVPRGRDKPLLHPPLRYQ